MQWDASEYAGFTTGEPWLSIPANHSYINVETEERDEDSILAYYKKLVQLRKDHEIIADGDIHFLETGTDDVIAYERTLGEEKLTVYCNLREYEVPFADLAEGEVLISNYAADELSDNMLKPYEARVIVA
jgi:trehalose-6-phosphate hydrolase